MSEETAARRDGFVVLTHLLSPRIERLIDRAREALAPTHAVHVVGGFPAGAEVPDAFRRREGFHAFGPEDLRLPHWPRKGREVARTLVGGAADLPVLALARRAPEIDRLWCFEGDVEFTGRLPRLLRHFEGSASDLLATSIRETPARWPHRKRSVRPPGWTAGGAERIAFLPAHRSSRALRAAVERFYAAGGDGHHEWVWPFAAQASGLTLEDIGGDGPHVRPENRGRFYTSSPDRRGLHPGSFRYRPVMTRPGKRRMTLWHPVKDWMEGDLPPWPKRGG